MKSIRMAIWLVIPILMIGLMVSLMAPLVALAQSSSIYSWTDENGVKHFSDRAPDNVEASQELIPKLQSAPPGDASSPASTLSNEPMADTPGSTAEDSTARSEQGSDEAELSYADQQRQAIAQRREAEKQKRSERDQLCLQARDELARIEPSRRVFSTDEDGNTTRLDDEERVRLVEASKSQIARYCD